MEVFEDGPKQHSYVMCTQAHAHPTHTYPTHLQTAARHFQNLWACLQNLCRAHEVLDKPGALGCLQICPDLL